jgi:hypothetical protein
MLSSFANLATAVPTNLFAGMVLDITPVTTTLMESVKIGLPAMIGITAIERGVGFLKGCIRG